MRIAVLLFGFKRGEGADTRETDPINMRNTLLIKDVFEM
jgi:hypothetical protein